MRFVIWENSVVLLAMESSAHDRKHTKKIKETLYRYDNIWFHLSTEHICPLSITVHKCLQLEEISETFLPTFLDTLTLQKACCPWGNQRAYQALETELSVWRGRRIRAERGFVWKKRCPLGKVAKRGHIHRDKEICQWPQTQAHKHTHTLSHSFSTIVFSIHLPSQWTEEFYGTSSGRISVWVSFHPIKMLKAIDWRHGWGWMLCRSEVFVWAAEDA